MPLLKKAGRSLSGKLTRVTLDRFIAAHGSDRRTLDIDAPEPPPAIDEIVRVLVPDGQLLLPTRFLLPIHDAPHNYQIACRKPPA